MLVSTPRSRRWSIQLRRTYMLDAEAEEKARMGGGPGWREPVASAHG